MVAALAGKVVIQEIQVYTIVAAEEQAAIVVMEDAVALNQVLHLMVQEEEVVAAVPLTHPAADQQVVVSEFGELALTAKPVPLLLMPQAAQAEATAVIQLQQAVKVHTEVEDPKGVQVEDFPVEVQFVSYGLDKQDHFLALM
jgi:hypothetical protein